MTPFLHNRRTFLGQSALATGLLLTGSRRLLASPNEQINLGIIGTGWRGGQLAEFFEKLPGVRIDTLCDVDSQRLAEAGDKFGVAKRTTDLQTVFDDPSIDAVVITTCNHWHCLAAIRACQAGKHVYVEKPLGHNLWEQQQLINAVRRYNRVVQVGTQQRSDPMQAEVKRFLHEKQGIGELTGAVACRFGARKSIGKRKEPLTPPSTMNYDRWLGPAQEQPVFRDQLHYDWHWDWNTGDGEMGNWEVHILDDVRHVALQDKVTLPKSVVSIGGRFEWDDAGNTPNMHLTLFESDSIPVVCAISNLEPVGGKKGQLREQGVQTGYVVYGEEGHYEGGRGVGAAFNSAGQLIRRFHGNSGEPHHYANFIDAVRNHTPETLNADVEVGHHSTAWCHLANTAYRLGKPVNEGHSPETISSNPMWLSSLRMFRNDFEMRGLDTASPKVMLSERLMVDASLQSFAGSQARSIFRGTYRPDYEVPSIASPET